MIEERLQFGFGEGSAFRLALGFVDVLRRPLPRHRIGVPGERPNCAFLVTDVSR
ncbi:hypothetical protein ACFWAR_00625 [Streptomyces sp. NPDC059917]|uniref:hypothetical protein n=1 Tax=Streptomyces sp. NPDC059917 TaxID=3347002 RepID=UPI0036470929